MSKGKEQFTLKKFQVANAKYSISLAKKMKIEIIRYHCHSPIEHVF